MYKPHCTECGRKDLPLKKALCSHCFDKIMPERNTPTTYRHSLPDYEGRPELEDLVKKGRENWTTKDWHWFRTYKAQGLT